MKIKSEIFKIILAEGDLYNKTVYPFLFLREATKTIHWFKYCVSTVRKSKTPSYKYSLYLYHY